MKLLMLIVFVLFSSVSLDALAQDVPKLTLSSSATIRKPADELQLKVGIITRAVTAEEALEENSFKMRNVVDNLEAAGLNKDDYETSQFSINPTYTPYPKNPPADWRQTINGYEVTNSILIHTDKLEMAGKVIDLSNKAGANSISDVRFGLRSSRDYWTEALSAAGANAVKDAGAIAAATGVHLVRVLSISLNHTHVRSPQINLDCFAKAGASGTSTPIEPGEVSIEANITMVYEIN
ncbi:hypothetical protein LCGC14_1543820 [marine sediment metagenome]|uniref:26 kDa periplasmic immunogenic protein n=1 Tax=marine sediment metagenome TaxID=412755 RepID=A0A0F9ISA8_9ZZZZ|nr:26 kDa periplasmic immunogenic protein [Candidatus Anoxychlamydiales bacterium]